MLIPRLPRQSAALPRLAGDPRWRATSVVGRISLGQVVGPSKWMGRSEPRDANGLAGIAVGDACP